MRLARWLVYCSPTATVHSLTFQVSTINLRAIYKSYGVCIRALIKVRIFCRNRLIISLIAHIHRSHWSQLSTQYSQCITKNWTAKYLSEERAAEFAIYARPYTRTAALYTRMIKQRVQSVRALLYSHLFTSVTLDAVRMVNVSLCRNNGAYDTRFKPSAFHECSTENLRDHLL